MTRTTDGLAPGAQITIELEPEMANHLRAAASRHDVTVSRYVRDAIEARLGQEPAAGSIDDSPLTAASDPVLADLWDNEHDAEYDRL